MKSVRPPPTSAAVLRTGLPVALPAHLALAALLAVLALPSCGATDAPYEPRANPVCPEGQTTNDAGACAPAPCEAGQIALDAGGCRDAGVPADACGQGFEPDDRGGCRAILPPAPCPSGQVAIPGETACHELAPCAAGTWGAIPVEPTTQYVDASYPSADSDGTAQRPWTTVQAAIDAAASGAIVAVAAGTYTEDLTVLSKHVRLWGKCPALVTLAGAGAAIAAVTVVEGTDHTELHDLGITGPKGGLVLNGTRDVVVENVWIHDTGSFGMVAAYSLGPVRATVRGSLLENDHKGGLVAERAALTVERTVVRGATGGWGIEIDPSLDKAATITSSVLEHNHGTALAVIGADVTVDSTLIRDTQSIGGDFDTGIAAQADYGKSNARATLTLKSSVLDHNAGVGVLVDGSDATIDASVVRETQGQATGLYGDGLIAKRGANATVRDSLFDGNHQEGVAVFGCAVALDGARIRDTQPNGGGNFGEGIGATQDAKTGEPATIAVSRSIVEGSHTAGIAVDGSHATIDSTVVRGTAASAAQGIGRGIAIQLEPTTLVRSDATIRASVIEDSVETGVCILDSDVTIEGSTVRGTQKAPDGRFGDGIAVVAQLANANVTMTDARVEKNARAGLLNYASAIQFGSCVFACNAFDLEGESAGPATYQFDHLGGNSCGCPNAASECQVLSDGLEPPPALK